MLSKLLSNYYFVYQISKRIFGNANTALVNISRSIFDQLLLGDPDASLNTIKKY